MSAGTENLIIDQGADWYVNFTYYTDSTLTTPVNLTGYTAALQLRSNFGDATSALSLSSPSNGIVITGAAGLISIHATAIQTGAIAAGYYEYDCEITSSGGIVTRLIQGQITVKPQVTR